MTNNGYPESKDEFKSYACEAIKDGCFYNNGKHNLNSYDGLTTVSGNISVWSKEFSESSELMNYIMSGNYSVSAFETSNGKREYLMHDENEVCYGSANNAGSFSDSCNKGCIVSGHSAGVHGFPCKGKYFDERIENGNISYIGELK